MNHFNKFLKLRDAKTQTVFTNVFFSFFIKGINIVVSFLTIPLVLSFLSNTQYGVWLTLTAILSWFTLFDFGFGNGLRNLLTTSIAKKDFEVSRVYVSTTYAALTGIICLFIVLFFTINPYIDWNSVFNSTDIPKSDLNIAVIYSISLLFIQFVLRLITTVLLAFQRSAMANLINAIIQVFILTGLYSLKHFEYNSLTSVSVVYSVVPIVVFLIFTIILFNGTYKDIRPSISFVRFKYARGLLNIGLNFFIIQIAALVIYASDNFIISQLFGPSDVTTYNIAFKYFSVGNVLFTIILAPFWSMTTKAYSEKDFAWIKSSMNKLFIIWIVFLVILLVQLAVATPIYKLWINKNVVVPLNLSIVMCIYYSVLTWGNLFSNFLNGVGKVRLQLYFACASMVINIPLAILLVKVFNLGVIGIPLATISVTSCVGVISFIQYKKIISSTASGIWNK